MRRRLLLENYLDNSIQYNEIRPIILRGKIYNYFSGKFFLLYILRIIGIAPQTFDMFIAEIVLFSKLTGPSSLPLRATFWLQP